jgi:para-aminobenzoate synthetase/4-amino-4-deoxychorismate lyase
MKLFVRDMRDRVWLRFEDPRQVIVARRQDEVRPALERVGEACGRGMWAAGFVSYEAGGAFDPAFATRPAGELPLLMFGVFDAPAPTRLEPASRGAYRLGAWEKSVTREAYLRAIDRIRGRIARGDTYQVNFTFRLRASFAGGAESLFADLARGANAPCAAFVDAGRFAILSLSPESFFTLEDGIVASRPMKGTAPRARTFAADEANAGRLRACAKNQAENVMIVDMVRNDIGRLAAAGSVCVTSLFDLERHPTVWQMTSTVTGRVDASLPEIMGAMFPPASVTGAPRAAAMAIIADLEDSPRGIYTGTIGFVAPGGRPRGAAPQGGLRAQFNVAIRTAVIDRERGEAEYGVGSGIVWESVPSEEWVECEAKTRVLGESRTAFRLLETLRWDPPGEPGREGGYHLLDAHLRRLAESAAYFQFEVDTASARRALFELARGFSPMPHRVRLLVDRDGACECESSPLCEDDAGCVRLALATGPVDSSDVFVYHKTTERAALEAARAAFPGADDVLLWNEHGEVTETTTANVCLRLGGTWVTPPVSSGLLAGTERERLLGEGTLVERTVTLDDLHGADGIAVVNSVRGWRPALLLPPSVRPLEIARGGELPVHQRERGGV